MDSRPSEPRTPAPIAHASLNVGALYTMLAIATGVCLAAVVGIALTRESGRIASVWMANGIVVTVLLKTPRASWPAWMAAGLAGNLAADLLVGDSSWTAMALSLCNSVEIVVAGWVTSHWVRADRVELTRSVPLTKFIVAGGLFAPMVSALLAGASLYALQGDPLWPVVESWFAADALGLVIVVPLLAETTWHDVQSVFRWPTWIETLVLLAVVVAAPVGAIWWNLQIWAFLLCPVMTAIAMRLGFAGAALANGLVTVAGIATVLAASQAGHADTVRDQILLLQCFLAANVLITLPVATLLRDVRASESRFRDALDHLPIPIGVATDSGRILQYNRAFTSQYGFTQDDIPTIGDWFPAAFPDPEYREVIRGLWTDLPLRMGRGGRSQSMELKVSTKSGSIRDVDVTICRSEGLYISAFLDITARKLAEAELQDSEAKYRILFDNQIYAVCIFEIPSLRLLDVNQACEQLYGYTRAELLSGLTVRDLSTEPESLDQVMSQAAAQHTSFVPLRHHRRKDGTVVPVEIVGGPYTWMGRRVMFALVHDISARTRAEAEAKRLVRELETILDAAPVGIWFVRDRRIVWANTTHDVIFGYSPGSTTGASTAQFYPDHGSYQRIGAEGYAAMAQGGVYRTDIEMVRKDGQRFWCFLSGRLIDTAQPEEGSIWTLSDTSDRHLAEAQLRRYAETQRVLVREVNHRVKNNLAAMIAILHMEEDRAPVAARTVLRDVGSRLRALDAVHSLLSRSDWQPLRLQDLCEQVCAVATSSAIGGRPRIAVTASDVRISAAQAHHVALIVSELATNAAKYGALSDHHPLHVVIAESDGHIAITVRDSGPGFPPDVLGNGPTPASVGLDLVRGMVGHNLHGTLAFANDGGAVVTVRFPAEPDLPPTPAGLDGEP
ncbi:MAG: PAS domain S-box protein [Acidobacteriota bacterium]